MVLYTVLSSVNFTYKFSSEAAQVHVPSNRWGINIQQLYKHLRHLLTTWKNYVRKSYYRCDGSELLYKDCSMTDDKTMSVSYLANYSLYPVMYTGLCLSLLILYGNRREICTPTISNLTWPSINNMPRKHI